MGVGKRCGSSRKGKPGLLQAAVGNGGANLKGPMSANGRQAHLTLLVHTSIDEAVDSTFGRGTRYRLAGPISAAVVDNRSRVLDHESLEIADQDGQTLELMVDVLKPNVLFQMVEHVLHGLRRFIDIAVPEKMAQPWHINGNVPKVDVQIAAMPEAFPCLFDVPKPHRQMEPVKDVGYRLPCCGEHNTLQLNIPVAEDSNVPARHPSLSPQRRTNRAMLASGDTWRGRELTGRPSR